MTIDDFIGSLGIKYLGKRRVKLLRESWKRNCPNPSNASAFDYTGMWLDSDKLVLHAKELGIPMIAQEIQKDLNTRHKLMVELLNHIVIIQETKKKAVTEGILAGHRYCFTGCRPKDDLRASIEKEAGMIVEHLNKDTTHLVQKDASSVSSKSKKARELGIKVISIDEIIETLQTISV